MTFSKKYKDQSIVMTHILFTIVLGMLLLSGTRSVIKQNQMVTQQNEVTFCLYGNDPQTQRLFVEVIRQLENHALDTRTITGSGDCLMNISYAETYGYYMIDPNTPESLPLSPVLVSPLDFLGNFALVVRLDESVPLEMVADAATGLSLYAVNLCNPGTSYLEAVLESLTRDFDEPEAETVIAFYLGNCALLEGNYDAATSFFEFAIERVTDVGINAPRSSVIEPGSAINLAWIYLQRGEHDKAFELMDRVIELSQSFYSGEQAYALSHRAQLYALAFRFDEAIADMDAAIELDPTNPQLYVLRGQITLYLYEWDRVLADYNHALELDPDYADAYYYRGILFYTQAQRDTALPDFQRYLELAPDGDHAADAAQYITDIERELEALNE